MRCPLCKEVQKGVGRESDLHRLAFHLREIHKFNACACGKGIYSPSGAWNCTDYLAWHFTLLAEPLDTHLEFYALGAR